MHDDAICIYRAAVEAVKASESVSSFCRVKDGVLYAGNITYDLDRFKKIFIIGAGKATASMAQAAEKILASRITSGIISVKYGHSMPLDYTSVIEAGHPVPDENSVTAANKILDTARKAGEDDLVICLLSGGGSSLLCLPAEGISLEDKQAAIRLLLSCGAKIEEINTIRKHLSGIKGGRLARAVWPARLLVLIVSDVIGDRLDVIASGPAVADPSTYSQALSIISRYGIYKKMPGSVIAHLEAGVRGVIEETPKPGDSCFETAAHFIVASNKTAIETAAMEAERRGYNALVLTTMLEGEARQAALFLTSVAKEIKKNKRPVPPRACIIAGGETTVTIRGKGKGGRNQEMALAGALAMEGEEDMVMLCCGSDGTDGPTDAAGAVSDPYTAQKARSAGIEPEIYLEKNDSYNFFKKIGGHVITGPTQTNVMDIYMVLIG